MTKQQEFRKQTEEAKIEAFSLMCKKAAELEKENAELRAIAENQQSSNMERYFKNKDLKKQLTKAKEIIKNLLSAYTTYADSFDDRDNDIVAEAEQFLREVEK